MSTTYLRDDASLSKRKPYVANRRFTKDDGCQLISLTTSPDNWFAPRSRALHEGRADLIAWLDRYGDLPEPSAAPTEQVPDPIEQVISRSAYLYSLPNDFDGEGSPGYSKETWERATGFLRDFAAHVKEVCRIEIEPPIIDPGPDGSIDLHWKTADYELLLNVKPASNEATFYGDNYGNAAISGKMNLSSLNAGLMMWLRDR